MGRLNNYLKGIGKVKFKETVKRFGYNPSYKVKFKLTYRCNLRCEKCNYWKVLHNDLISTNKAVELIEQISRIGCHFIKFSGGEVTLRDDLPELIRCARDKGMETSITTNGTLIDQKKASELIGSGITQINISIDSHDESIHDGLVGIKGAWKRSTDAFKYLNKERNNKERNGSDTRLVLQTVVCSDNYRDIIKIAELAKKINTDSLSLLGFVPYHLKDASLDVNAKEIEFFINKTLPQVKSYCEENNISLVNTAYSEISTQGDYYSNNPCFIPFMNYYITPDGNVYVCCFSKVNEHVMGNIFDDDLKTIIRSERFNEFRKNCYPICKNNVCKRCIGEIRTNEDIKSRMVDI